MLFVFFFKQKTAYEVRISDWSSDVCSSDLRAARSSVVLRCWTARALARSNCGLRGAMSGSCGNGSGPGKGCGMGSGIGIGKTSRISRSRPRKRTEERLVGEELSSKCNTRWSPYVLRTKNYKYHNKTS